MHLTCIGRNDSTCAWKRLIFIVVWLTSWFNFNSRNSINNNWPILETSSKSYMNSGVLLPVIMLLCSWRPEKWGGPERVTTSNQFGNRRGGQMFERYVHDEDLFWDHVHPQNSFRNLRRGEMAPWLSHSSWGNHIACAYIK